MFLASFHVGKKRNSKSRRESCCGCSYRERERWIAHVSVVEERKRQSFVQTCTFATLSMRKASSALRHVGLSQSTCFPARSAATDRDSCMCGGSTTVTRSTFSRWPPQKSITLHLRGGSLRTHTLGWLISSRGSFVTNGIPSCWPSC